MSLFEDFQTVFAAAASFSAEKTAQMDQRQEALKAIQSTLQGWLPAQLLVGDQPINLRVGIGGRQGSNSPVAWVRVFSPAYSRTATEGFYLVYLFACDGSAVFLSLNQGTSEFRYNAVRPIDDEGLLTARAAGARKLFNSWPRGLLEGLSSMIDLAVDAQPVGNDSKQRSRNYELANVYAVSYPADTPVSDETLRSDLYRMLSLLATVYARPEGIEDYSIEGSALIPTGQLATGEKSSGQAWVADSRLKKAIEDYSMAMVMWLCIEAGEWDVEDVSKRRPYDIHLRRKSDQLDIHVEVKGTRSAGEKVFLTKNEVDNAQTYEHTILAVVHSIDVSLVDDILVCSGGQMRVINPWTPTETDLTATQYEYLVPLKSE